MYRVGILGTGFMGRTHSSSYAAIKREQDVAVAAIASQRPEDLKSFAQTWPEAKLYSDGMEMIEKETLDAVDICLPTHLHTKHAVAAMKKGFDVFVEKPVCISFAEAEELLETKARTGAQVMVGQVLRFWPEYCFLKEAVESGRYGKISSLVMYRQNSSDKTGPRGWNDWYSDPANSGSAIVDLHIHDIDIARWIFGEPDGFTIFAQESAPKYFGHVLVKYAYDSAFVTAEAANNYVKSMPFEMAYRACFEKAALVYNSNMTPTLKVHEGVSDILTPEFWVGEADDIKQLSGYYGQLRYFVKQRVAGKQIEINSLEDAIKTTKLALTEYNQALKEYGSED